MDNQVSKDAPKTAANKKLPEPNKVVPVPESSDTKSLFKQMQRLIYRRDHQELANRIFSGWPVTMPAWDDGIHTLAHTAAFNGDIITLRLLQRAGMDMDIRSTLDRGPIFSAFMRQHAETINWLISQGVSIDQHD
ncbi:MAG: hypothetical protein Alpg2KO_30270 [Alphaproteobacteria bacterium]